MATLRGFNRKFYMSAKTYEGTFGTGEAEAAMYPIRVDSDAFQIVPEYQDDTDLVGGSEEATAQQELARSVRGNINANRVQPNLVAAIAGFGMEAGGGVASSNVEDSVYTHTIEPNTSTFVLPSFTALDLFTTTLYLEYTGCMVNSFTLSCARKGWLALTSDIIGCGTYADSGVTVGSLGSAISETYLKAGDAYVFLQGAPSGAIPDTYNQQAEDLTGTGDDVKAKIVSFNWTYNNNIASDDLYDLGSGLVMGSAERDRRSQTLSFSVEFEDLTYLNYLVNQTEIAMEFDFTAANASLIGTTKYYGAQIIFSSLKLTSCRISGGTGKLIADCEALVMENDESTPDPTVQVVVCNLQTSYLTT